MKVKRLTAVAVVAGSLVVGGATAALAATRSNNQYYRLATTGVSYADAYSYFDADSVNHGAFEYRGKLFDDAADGNPVFLHSHSDGYGYSKTVYMNAGYNYYAEVDDYQYSAASTYTSHGTVEVCRDRSFYPDDCNAKSFTR